MTAFRIGFDGPAVDNGEIDVSDLAPALLAPGEFFEATNHVLNKDWAEATLKIKATEKGSFIALLSLDVSFITDILDAVTAHPDRITAADQLLDLVIKGGTIIGTPVLGALGYFGVLKRLRGQKPDSATNNDDGTTTLVVGSTALVVDQKTIILLEDFQTRAATEKFVRTAFRPKGIQAIMMDEEGGNPDEAPDLVLYPQDIASMAVPEPSADEVTTTTDTREALLKIITGQFEEGYKWRFTDGTNTFTASMEDAVFVKRLDNSEIVLSKNDTLRCVIEETQQLAGSQLKTDAKIIHVKDHISGARQLRLL